MLISCMTFLFVFVKKKVLEQLKLFKPTPKMIKVQIENLITRDFLERDPDDSRVYLLSVFLVFVIFFLSNSTTL